MNIQKLRQVVAEVSCMSIDDVTDEARLREDLLLDAYDVLDLAFEIDEAFSIDVPDADFEGLTTFGELAKVVEKYAEAE